MQISSKSLNISARHLGLSDFSKVLVVGCQECQPSTVLLRKVIMQSVVRHDNQTKRRG